MQLAGTALWVPLEQLLQFGEVTQLEWELLGLDIIQGIILGLTILCRESWEIWGSLAWCNGSCMQEEVWVVPQHSSAAAQTILDLVCISFSHQPVSSLVGSSVSGIWGK